MPSQTPDGTIKTPSDPTTITSCWIQAADFPNLAAYKTDPTKSPYLDAFILTACSAINTMCNRKFNKQQQDYTFQNTALYYRDYRPFNLPNRPLVSVDGLWLQVVNTWASVNLQFTQIIGNTNQVKVLPTFQTYVQTTLPLFVLEPSTNLYFRYTAGYAVDYSNVNSPVNEVPMVVRIATAMYVDYLYSRFTLTGGITRFRTQTYSQTSAMGDKDPVLTAIDTLIKPYKELYVV